METSTTKHEVDHIGGIIEFAVLGDEIILPNSRLRRRRNRKDRVNDLNVVSIAVFTATLVQELRVPDLERIRFSRRTEEVFRRIAILVDLRKNLRNRIDGEGDGIREHVLLLEVNSQAAELLPGKTPVIHS